MDLSGRENRQVLLLEWEQGGWEREDVAGGKRDGEYRGNELQDLRSICGCDMETALWKLPNIYEGGPNEVS